jgi:hypothetical protein
MISPTDLFHPPPAPHFETIGEEKLRNGALPPRKTETDSGLWCKLFRKLVCKLVAELNWKAYYINKLVPPLSME